MGAGGRQAGLVEGLESRVGTEGRRQALGDTVDSHETLGGPDGPPQTRVQEPAGGVPGQAGQSGRPRALGGGGPMAARPPRQWDLGLGLWKADRAMRSWAA